MPTHVHIGFVPFVITAAMVVLTLFVMRWIAAMWPESAIGKALAALN